MKNNSAGRYLAFALLCGTQLLADAPVDEVREAEAAFAATMASRALAKFGDSVSPEAVFFTGGKVLRGKQAVLTEWKNFFNAPEAPFSWQPEVIEVLDSGKLAMSSGPVFDRSGAIIARFNSIWRLEDDGKWRVIFDKGEKVCQ